MPNQPVIGTPTVAPLTNVALTLQALERADTRSTGLPGVVVLHGPSGWGKSTAAAYAAVRTSAYYVAMKSLWTRRAFLDAVANQMGLPTHGTLAALAGRISQQLTDSGRPLLIDEADVLAERDGGAGLIKDLYESTLGTILLIGEEKLPHKLARYERLHGRVLEWVAAQPASLADATVLCRIYCPAVQVGDDLLKALVGKSKGSVRRIAVNLDRIRQEAKALKWDSVDLALWGDRQIYTGEPPARRVS